MPPFHTSGVRLLTSGILPLFPSLPFHFHLAFLTNSHPFSHACKILASHIIFHFGKISLSAEIVFATRSSSVGGRWVWLCHAVACSICHAPSIWEHTPVPNQIEPCHLTLDFIRCWFGLKWKHDLRAWLHRAGPTILHGLSHPGASRHSQNSSHWFFTLVNCPERPQIWMSACQDLSRSEI